MNTQLDRLGPKERKGSKPRCHWMMHGNPERVARRLTKLIEPWGRVASTDRWMPEGFENTVEAELHNAPNLVDPILGRQLQDWWLAVATGKTKTPTWDVASTCTVSADGKSKPGLLLVEAKAHDGELNGAADGKVWNEGKASDNSKKNHEKIGAAIRSAQEGLREATSLEWNLYRDQHYQMSNRFAWSWKLTELGFPVILVYLGFLNADEMPEPFPTPAHWDALVKSHSRPLVPETVWENAWTLHGQLFIPLIRSAKRPYDGPSPEDQA